MADVADTLINQGFKMQTGEIQQQSADAVVGLVNKVQDIQTKRAQLEEMKQQMENAKMTKFVDALEKGKSFDGSARNNYYKKFMPRLRDSLGLTDKFPDDSLDFMTSTDSNINRMSFLVGKVRRGEMTSDEALGFFNDPTKASILPGYQEGMFSTAPTEEEIKSLGEAEKFAIGERGKTQRTAMTTAAAATRQATDIAATGEKAIASKAGAGFVEWQDAKSGVEGSLVKLDRAVEKLRNKEITTGTGPLKAVSFWDAAQDMTHPEVASVRDDIRSAIQSSLKAIMGAQFTEKEATDMFNRAFNPRLSNAENAKRAQTEINTLRKKMADKDKLFQRQGFVGQGQSSEQAPQESNPKQQQIIAIARKYLQEGKTPDDIAAILQKKGQTFSQIQAIISAAGRQ